MTKSGDQRHSYADHAAVGHLLDTIARAVRVRSKSYSANITVEVTLQGSVEMTGLQIEFLLMLLQHYNQL